MKIFRKLKLIPEYEWKDYEKFVSSPFFNKGRNYIPLLNILKEFYPEFKSQTLTGECIYKKLYPGKKYNENVIKTVFSGLSILTDEFFLQQNFKKNSNREIRLLNEYIQRGDEQKAGKYASLVESGIKKIPSDSLDFFENLDKIDALQLYYAMNYDKRKRYGMLVSGIRNLFCFSMMQFFIFKKEILLYDRRYSDDEFNSTLAGKLSDSIEIEKMLEFIREDDAGSFPLLKMYYLIMKQVSDIGNDEYYFELRKLLLDNLNSFDTETVNRLLLNIMSVCNMKSNSGKKEFIHESFKIMKQLVGNNYFDKIHGTSFFPPSHFRNIVKAGLAVNETEWVEKFVSDYAPKLDHYNSEPLKNYSLAKICFAGKKFKDSLEYLGKVNTENMIFKLDIKKLTAMIYYETKSFVNLQSLLNTYYMSVAVKNKKEENILNRHRNFIFYLRKLDKIINESRDLTEITVLQKSLQKDNVSEKNWLNEKFLEAEKSSGQINLN